MTEVIIFKFQHFVKFFQFWQVLELFSHTAQSFFYKTVMPILEVFASGGLLILCVLPV
jgi:hypothetical protein